MGVVPSPYVHGNVAGVRGNTRATTNYDSYFSREAVLYGPPGAAATTIFEVFDHLLLNQLDEATKLR